MSLKPYVHLAVALGLVATTAAPAAAQNLYGATDSGDSVVIFDTVTGAVLDEIVAPGEGGLDSAEGLALGPDGDLYVSSANTDTVLRFNGINGDFVDDFAGGPPLVSPMGIAFGPDGNLYVASRLTNEVLMYDGDTGEFIIDFVPFKEGGLLTPEALVFAPGGDLLVASANTNEILRFSGVDGSFVGVFADGGGLDYPHGMAFGPTGHLFVSSHFSNAVLEYTAAGAYVGDAIAPGAGGLDGPIGITFAPDGTFFVASFNTGSILHHAVNGSVTTLSTLATPISHIAVINRPSLVSVTVSATNVPGGCTTVTGTVTIDRAAPAGGINVGLSSTNSAASVPALVSVPQGATSANFVITTSQVLTPTAGQIRAVFGGLTKFANLTLRPVRLSAHSISPTTIAGGSSAAGSVSIECAAPTPGVTVSLTSSNTAIAQTPATIVIAPGQLTAGYTLTTSAPATTTSVTVSAAAGGTTLSRGVSVTTAANLTLTAVAVSPSVIVSGRSGVGTVSIGAPAGPGGVTVGLSLSPGLHASLASPTVTIAQGQTSATFAINTSDVSTNQTETVTATLGAQTRSRTFTVAPNTPKLLQLQPSSLRGGNSSLAKVTLQEPAGAGGVTVFVTSSNPAAANPLVPSFVIAAGTAVGSTTITTTGVATNTALTITVTANGGSRAATLTVTP